MGYLKSFSLRGRPAAAILEVAHPRLIALRNSTLTIKDAVAENKTIHPGTASDYGIRSVSLPGAAYVYV